MRTAPPRLNHCSICCVFVPEKYLSKILPIAVRIRSRTTTSAPRISPSYSSSSFPVMPGMAAYRSLTRGTTSFSPCSSARPPPLGVGNPQPHGGDGQTLADTAALIHLLIFARGESHLLDDLAQIL